MVKQARVAVKIRRTASIKNIRDKKLPNSNVWISRKMQKKICFGHLGTKGPIFGQNGQKGENYQKITWKIFSPFRVLSKLQSFRKSNDRISRKDVANG